MKNPMYCVIQHLLGLTNFSTAFQAAIRTHYTGGCTAKVHNTGSKLCQFFEEEYHILKWKQVTS